MKKFVDWTCPVCGDVLKIYPSEALSRKFCSKRCYGLSQRSIPKKKVDHDDSIYWVWDNGRFVCPYAEAVSCEVRHCSKCGWNPEVKAKRDEEIRRKYGNQNV